MIAAYERLFAAFPSSANGEETERLEIRVIAQDARWAVELDGLRAAAFETAAHIPPFLETLVCQFLIQHRADRIPIHAAGVASAAGVVLMPGEKGSGKSTLSLWLAQRGYAYFGDELLWIDPTSALLEPYPKAAAIKAGSFALFDEAEIFDSPTRGPLRYFAPGERAAPLDTARPAARIVFPHFNREEPAGVYPLCPEETLLYLSQMLFGGLARRPERFPALARLAQTPAVLAVYRDAREIEEWLRAEVLS